MQARGLLNYRLKFYWLKVICCIRQSNEIERKIKHKTGGLSKGPAENLEGHVPSRPPLRTATGSRDYVIVNAQLCVAALLRGFLQHRT